MTGDRNDASAPLRVVHVLRAPLGGLFRHVVDLTLGQIARGHAVGLIADDRRQNDQIERWLAELAPTLALGLSRVRIDRHAHPTDFEALLHVGRRMRLLRPHVLHGHGSKGGALARLTGFVPGLPPVVRAYTPHGGSLNYRPGSAQHALYMEAERILRRRTDLQLFESGFIASRYGQFVGRPPRLNRVIHNGIAAAEFEPVRPGPEAADFVYVGELRSAKGIDVLLFALARVGAVAPSRPTLALVGTGPDRSLLQEQAETLGVTGQVKFHGALPARTAFRLGRTMVVPSRAESMPYVVLEAAAAQVPLIATNVGGIPEIFGPQRRRLIPADSVTDLTDAMLQSLQDGPAATAAASRELARYVQGRFSIDRMIDAVLFAYREALMPTPAVLQAGHPMVLPS